MEKKAFLGFSKEERRNKALFLHSIETNNLMAKHGNPHIKKLNDEIRGKVSGREFNNKYIDRLFKDKDFAKDFESVHNKYREKIKSLGGQDIGDHKAAFKQYGQDWRTALNSYDYPDHEKKASVYLARIVTTIAEEVKHIKKANKIIEDDRKATARKYNPDYKFFTLQKMRGC